jgi:hypothetical protein
MAKAVITILGLAPKPRSEARFAEYYFNGSIFPPLLRNKHITTFHLFANNLGGSYDIIPIYTKEAEKRWKSSVEEFQLEGKSILWSRYQEQLISDLNNLDDIFSSIKTITEDRNYDEFIIDMVQGPRGVAIVETLLLKLQWTKISSKVSKIFIGNPAKNGFELLNIKEYFELSEFAQLLVNFNSNYTLGIKREFSNLKFQKIVKELNKFSQAILSNSFNSLIRTSGEENRSTVDDILEAIGDLENDTKVSLLSKELEDVKEHISEIQKWNYLPQFQKYYNFSRIMFEKGYLLNSISLLNEVTGLYAKERFKSYSTSVKKAVESYETEVKSQEKRRANGDFINDAKNYHELVKISQDAIRFGEKSKKGFLGVLTEVSRGLERVDRNRLFQFKNLLKDIADTRNDLAHGNASSYVLEVEKRIKGFFEDLEYLVLTKDILKV